MTKLKCWKKIGFASKGGAYERKDTTSKRVVIDKYDKEWVVEKQNWNNRTGRNDKILKKSRTKPQAIKFANKYMKSHDKC